MKMIKFYEKFYHIKVQFTFPWFWNSIRRWMYSLLNLECSWEPCALSVLLFHFVSLFPVRFIFCHLRSRFWENVLLDWELDFPAGHWVWESAADHVQIYFVLIIWSQNINKYFYEIDCIFNIILKYYLSLEAF